MSIKHLLPTTEKSYTMDPFKCARAGNVKFFEEVELDIIQNSRDQEGDSVLSLAALTGRLDCCQVIYKRCPELLYETNEDNSTALHHAAYCGRDNVIKFLLSARGEEEDSEIVQEDIETRGSVKQYVDYKLLMMVDINLETALHKASKRGEIQSTKLLLQADPCNMLLTVLNSNRNTALHSAVQNKHLEIVRLLLEKDPAFVYSANKSGHTPFSIASEAATSGDPISVAIRELLVANNSIGSEIPVDPFKCARAGNVKFFEEVELDIIQNSRDQEGDSVLSLAAWRGQLDCCQVIYKRCPELLYETNENKSTALHHAAYCGRDEVIKFLLSARGEEEDSEIVQEDIETGVSVKQYVDYQLLMMVDSELETALHLASESGEIQSTKLLLQADPSNKLLTVLSSTRNTALHLAVQNKHLEIVRLLLEKDRTFQFVYSANQSGHTPFSIASEAAKSGDPISVAIRELLAAVDPFECARAGNVKFFEEVELDIIQNSRDQEGDSVLSLAAWRGQLDCCQVIYKRCPELLYETNEDKFTALHHAACNGKDEVIKFLLSARGEGDIETGGSVKQYVDYQLLMMVDSELETALHFASESGEIQSTKLLLQADPSNKLLTVLSSNRNTALHLAVQNKHLEIVRLLLEKDPGFVYSANKSGHTPFSIASEAAKSGDPISVAIRELLVANNSIGSEIPVDPFKCARAGNVKFFEEVELDIIQNSRDQEGDSVLSLAALKGRLDCCQVIYKRCPELLYETNENKSTALHHAAYKGKDEVIKFLLSARSVQEDIETGGSVKQYVDYMLLIMVDSNLETALHKASKRGEIQSTKLLLQADPSNKLLTMLSSNRNTALHLAVQNKHLEIVRLLLEKDPGFVYLPNKSGHTPFSIASEAAKSGDPISVAIRDLLTVHNTRRSKVSIDPLECLRKGDVGFFEEVELFIIENWRDEDGCSILYRAASIGHLNCCQVIYRRCPQLLYEPNNDKLTALHASAYNGKDEVVKFLLSARGQEENSVAVRGDIETLGRVEPYVNYKLLMMVSKGMDSALHSASKMGRVQSAKLLLQADPSNKLFKMENVGKRTAMHYAVKFQQLGIVNLLMETDPDFVYSRDNSGYTPHFKALQESFSGDNTAVAIRKLLIENLPDQCKIPTGENGWTLLHHATFKKDLAAIAEILEFCPDCAELVTDEGQNFIHLAAKLDHEEVIRLILGSTKVHETILNHQDINGNTPFHIATSRGSQSIGLAMLYDSRVEKFVLNNQKKTALAAIDYDYDKRRAGVYGYIDRVSEKDLKDRSDFDLLVGALISTVSFTAGITVPGGFFSDGPNQGNAVLYKKKAFEAFVLSNTIAMALSLYAVFSHFCTRRLINEDSIVYQLKVATYCTLGAIFAMMVAFITGSYAVLTVSDELSISVCVISSCFFVCAFHAIWKVIMEQKQRRPRHGA